MATFSGYGQITPATASVIVAPSDSVLLAPDSYKTGPYKSYLNRRYAQDEEARAVIHLFSRKQTGGAVWLVTGAAVIGLVACQTGTKTTSSGTTTTTITPLGYGLLLGTFGGVGSGKLAHFSNNKLYNVLGEYERSHSLPGYVTEQLRKKAQR